MTTVHEMLLILYTTICSMQIYYNCCRYCHGTVKMYKRHPYLCTIN